MEFRVKETECRTALHFHNSKWLPFRYDLNVYRGCAHRCIYCYALYSHEYIDGGSFYDEIYAKVNIADILRQELPRFSRETVNLGGVTDSYQPAEKEYRLMPEVLELFARYVVPANICTKSPLILRDIGVLKKVNEAGGLSAAFTITTMNKTVAGLIEPNAPPPKIRMDAVREIKKAGLFCGVQMMPIIPVLTSGTRDIEAVFSAAKDAGADYIFTSALNLKNRAFFDSVKSSFPNEYGKIRDIFRDKKAYKEYRNDLEESVRTVRNKFRMPSYVHREEKADSVQLSFLGEV
jgi:DNA repair photolyase